MLRPLRAPLLVTFLGLWLAESAVADRLATGPVRDPHVIDSHHVAFTLPGNTWSQVRGLMSGTPSLGGYVFQRGSTAATSLSGHLRVYVHARVRKTRPVLKERRLLLDPSAGKDAATLRVSGHGVNGPVHWYFGTSDDGIPTAAGYQVAPPSLRSAQKRWVVYVASTEGTEPSVTTSRTRRREATTTVRSVARTMRLRSGRAVPKPPFTPA